MWPQASVLCITLGRFWHGGNWKSNQTHNQVTLVQVCSWLVRRQSFAIFSQKDFWLPECNFRYLTSFDSQKQKQKQNCHSNLFLMGGVKLSLFMFFTMWNWYLLKESLNMYCNTLCPEILIEIIRFFVYKYYRFLPFGENDSITNKAEGYSDHIWFVFSIGCVYRAIKVGEGGGSI